MSNDSFKVKKSLNIEPKASPVTDSQGDIAFNSATDKLVIRDSTSTKSVVTESGTATLTNKTIDGASNTITNIPGSAVDLSGNTSVGVATSNTASTVNIGTGTGANTINIGGANSTINMTGTVNSQNVTNLEVADKLITINNGGAAASGAVAGIEIEENGSATGHIKTSGDRAAWEFKAPGISGTVSVKPENSVDQDVVLTSRTQTVSNKTLTDATFTSGTITTGETASTVLVTNASGKMAASAVTTTELNKLSGIGTIVETAATQTLTNKTFGDALTMDGQASTPSTPPSGFYKLYVSDSTQKLSLLDPAGTVSTVGTGAGGGGINYIASTDGSTSTGWVTYADTSSAQPADGTGGSANVTFATSTNSDLRGTTNFLFTHDAADRRGQGFSYDFTIDKADQAKMLQISFDYLVASGTYADGDLTVWIYDVTNATLIQPAPYKILNAIGAQTWSGEFQTASNSTSYRLIFHVTTTTATAYTMRFDSVTVGPKLVNMGVPVTDWVSYTPTFANFGTVTNVSVYSRRVADSLEIQGQFQVGTGLAAVGTLTIGFNGVSGNVSYDQNKIAGSTIVGEADSNLTASTTNFGAISVINQSLTTLSFGLQTSTATRLTPQNGSTFSGFYVRFFAKVPIAGWSSNTVMSSDAATNVVAFSGYDGSPITVNNTSTVLPLGTIRTNTHAAIASNAVTIPVAGYYDIFAHSIFQMSSVSTFDHNLYIDVDGVSVASDYQNGVVNAANIYQQSLTASTVIYLRAGQVVRFYHGTNFNFDTASLKTWSIKRVNSPAQIAASETVFEYMTITNAATGNILNSTSTDLKGTLNDSASGALNASTGVFTAPNSGRYEFYAWLALNSTSNPSGSQLTIVLSDAANNNLNETSVWANGTYSERFSVNGTFNLKMLAGQQIKLRVFQATGATRTIAAGYASFKRIGNY